MVAHRTHVFGPPPAPPSQEGRPSFLKVTIGHGGGVNGSPPVKEGLGVVAHGSQTHIADRFLSSPASAKRDNEGVEGELPCDPHFAYDQRISMSEGPAHRLPLRPLAKARGMSGSMAFADPGVRGGGTRIYIFGPPPAPPSQEGCLSFLKVANGQGGDVNGSPPAKEGLGVVAHGSGTLM